MTPLRPKLEENLGRIALVLLVVGCVWVLSPFATALLWAVVVSYASWPLYRRVLGWFGGRRTLAALAMGLGMICFVLLPFVVAGVTLADNVKALTAATRSWLEAGLPEPPAWVAKIPLVGTSVAEEWQALTGDSAKVLEIGKSLVESAGARVLKAGLKLGGGLFELALSIFITFFLLRDGPYLAERLTTSVGRIAGERGKHLLEVAGNTVRGVVYGILGTALVQALMAGLGLMVAGVPGAGLLAMLVFPLALVPAGPFLVLMPAAFWLFHQDATGWGIFMLIWSVGVSTVDNFVRPWLISQGSALPFVLIFFGVVGGALTLGFIGVFIGPTLLAVGYRVLQEWLSTRQVTTSADSPG